MIEGEESTEEIKPDTEVEVSTQAIETDNELGSPERLERLMKRTSSFVLDKDSQNIPLDLDEHSTHANNHRNKRYPRENYKVWPYEIGFDRIDTFQKYFEHNNFKALTFAPVEREEHEVEEEKPSVIIDYGDRFLGF